MKKYYILSIFILIGIVLIYFLVSNKKESKQTEIIKETQKEEKINTTNKIIKDDKIKKNTEPLLIDKIITTNIDEPNKNFNKDTNYAKPEELIKENKKENKGFNIGVDINKETKELEKIKFGLEKNF